MKSEPKQSIGDSQSRLSSVELQQKRKSVQLQFNKYIVQKDLNYHQFISQHGDSIQSDEDSKPSIQSVPLYPNPKNLQFYNQQLLSNKPSFSSPNKGKVEQSVQIKTKQVDEDIPLPLQFDKTVSSKGEVGILHFDQSYESGHQSIHESGHGSIHEDIDQKADNPFSASYKNSSLFHMSRSELPQIESYAQKQSQELQNVINEKSQEEIDEFSVDQDIFVEQDQDIFVEQDQVKDQDQVILQDQVQGEVLLLQSIKDSSELKDVSHMHSSMQNFKPSQVFEQSGPLYDQQFQEQEDFEQHEKEIQVEDEYEYFDEYEEEDQEEQKSQMQEQDQEKELLEQKDQEDHQQKYDPQQQQSQSQLEFEMKQDYLEESLHDSLKEQQESNQQPYDHIQFEEDDQEENQPSIDSQEHNYPIQTHFDINQEVLVESNTTDLQQQSDRQELQQQSDRQENTSKIQSQIEKVSECKSEEQASPPRDTVQLMPQFLSIYNNYTSQMIIFEQQEDSYSEVNKTLGQVPSQQSPRPQSPSGEENYSYTQFRATFQTSIQKKLTEELFIDEFNKSALMKSINRSKMYMFVQRYADLCEHQELHTIVTDLQKLNKVIRFQLASREALKGKVFQAFKINMENQRVKNYYGMLTRKFRFKVVERKKRSIFYEIKYYAEQLIKKTKLASRIMKTQKIKLLLSQWKLFTYVQKANRQMALYYKGVLLRNWGRVVSAGIEQRDIKSLSFFYYSLIGRTFLRWKKLHKQIKREKAIYYRVKKHLQLRKKQVCFYKFKQFVQRQQREKSFNNPDLVKLSFKLSLS